MPFADFNTNKGNSVYIAVLLYTQGDATTQTLRAAELVRAGETLS